MSFRNLVTEKIILPLSDLVTGQSIGKYLRFLNKSQYWSRLQIDEFQNQKLKKLIHHVYEFVPYYTDLFKELGLKPSDFKTKEDLVKLPILTKETIKKEGIERFTSTAIPKHDLIKSGSSGSTGEPLFYWTTKEAYSLNVAASLRGWYSMGYRLGDKYVKLSQNPRKRFIKRIQDKLSNNLYLSTNPLVDSNFEHILREIEKYKPKVIRCYPDPLLFLARYKKDHPEFKHIPEAITTTGNTLFPETREEIESLFGCKIFDAYSCEGNSIVFECPTHSCYHSCEEYGISEIVDDNLVPINKGIGRLISTDLWNLAHPFIRYDTQDFIELEPGLCSCGRQHLKIMRIIGRDNDILEMESGRKFIVHNFTGFFQTDLPEINASVDQFQVIKEGSIVIFKLVVNNRYSDSVSDFIKKFWENEMNTTIKVEIVDYIPLTKSGKRRFILNR